MGVQSGARVTPPPWLILASAGPALALPRLPGRAPARAIDDPAAFAAALVVERPRLAVVAFPPGDATLLGAVARVRRQRSSLRVVALSPPEAIETRLRALEAGFDDALPDSVDAFELAHRLALLDERRRRPRTSAVLPVTDSAELDLVAHELRRDGTTVHLRPKEFALLAMLAAHPGRAYSRRQLLDRVWEANHLVDPRTVDVHIRWLRAKVEPDPDRPTHLMTVRGVGYRLDAPER